RTSLIEYFRFFGGPMKNLILVFSFFAAASAHADLYPAEFLGERWFIEGERLESQSDWAPSVTFNDVRIYNTDAQGRPVGDAYLLAVNSNGWGDAALNVVCDSVTAGEYPYAYATKTVAG